MKLTVNPDNVIRKWPRMESYQNSTLRFTPPTDFPEYCASKIGSPRIMRVWVTLDEVWDYRTDTYNWNFDIGVNNYEDDRSHHCYDWKSVVPLGQKYEDYLRSYSQFAESVLLNIRRYEREVTDGLISIEKYEEVVYNVIEYYKNLEPKIMYIESCNEVEYVGFGGLTVAQYYELYKATCRACRRLNEKYHYERPLAVGGYGKSGGVVKLNIWYQFLQLLAADNSPELMPGFYSVHSYSADYRRATELAIKHSNLIRRLGLPDVPLFIDEFGTTGATGIPEHNLKNASGVLAAMILASQAENTYIFPWCTFHSPKRQINYTQFIATDDGKFVPTPNGNAMIAMHMLAENEVEIWEYTESRAVACADDEKITLLVTNPGAEPLELDVTFNGIRGYKARVARYICDEAQNNCLTGEPCEDFLPTSDEWMGVDRNGAVNMKFTLGANAFCFIKIDR